MSEQLLTDSIPQTGPGTAMVAAVRLAVIGVTLGRARYGAALLNTPAVRVAALVDADVRLARAFARDVGGRPAYFESAAELISSGEPLDALLVAVPPAARPEYLAEALKAGKPIVCDAPYARRPGESAAQLNRRSTRSILMPSFGRRFDPWFVAMRDLLRAEAVGTVRQARCDLSFPAGGWFAAQNGGDPEARSWHTLLPEMACQTIDVCRAWFGGAESVSADIDLPTAIVATRPGAAPPAVATIIMTHENAQSTHHLSRARGIHPTERYTVTGALGSLELVVSAGESGAATEWPTLRMMLPGRKPEIVQVSAPERHIPPDALGLHRLLAHFADCIRGGAAPALDEEDARAALEVIEAANISSAEHVKVSLPLPV